MPNSTFCFRNFVDITKEKLPRKKIRKVEANLKSEIVSFNKQTKTTTIMLKAESIFTEFLIREEKKNCERQLFWKNSCTRQKNN